jgi:ATP-dependent RNA helicase RhlE
MSGKDVIGLAQTGTGKTYAYLLPVLRMLKFSEQQSPRVLVIVPTRELVVQVLGEIEKLCKYTNIRYGGIYGGSNINPQKKLVSAGLDVLVSTPGRLVDLAMLGILKLKQVNHFIIDEVDEMLETGFRAQLTTVLDLLPPKRQNIFFSATMNKEVFQLIETFTKNPQKIEVVPHGTPLKKIKQSAYSVPNYYTKVNLLYILLANKKTLSKVMVFVSNIKLADRLYGDLKKTFGNEISVIHSNKSQNIRFSTLDEFHQGLNRILVATDIAARGLDILDVSHIINFDTPMEAGDYLHRIGRTGRAGKNGKAITLVNGAEEAYLEKIEGIMKQKIKREELPAEVKISTLSIEEELPKKVQVNYLEKVKTKVLPKGFHEKKAKNTKVNLGGPRKRNPNKIKPRNRAVERNRARKGKGA